MKNSTNSLVSPGSGTTPQIFRFIFTCIFILLAAGAQATVRYVKTDGSDANTGLSWAQAYLTIQKALEAAVSGDEIWVKSGTYKPTKEFDGTTDAPRDFTFYLKDGVAIYGGFAGTETLLSQRNQTTNVTILSGDIGTVGDNSDNCHHVVLSVSDAGTTELDGFTVTKGNADGTGSFLVETKSIGRTLGGGMYNHTTSATVTNCIFELSTGSNSGGMFNNSTINLAVTNCVFSSNTSTSSGTAGGGVYNFASSVVSFTNCTFSGNSGNTAGAMLNSNAVNAVVTNCIFSGNSSAGSAGAMTNQAGSNPVVTNCLFSGNYGVNGAFFNNSSSPTLINCTISGNSTLNLSGSGGLTNSSSTPTLKNCLIWNNRVDATTGSAAANLVNISSTPVISYSLIQNWNPSGTGNLDGIPNAATSNYPNFVTPLDPATAPSTAGDFHIQAVTPAANVGTGTEAPATDLFGNVRPFGASVDLGVHELQSANTPACPATGSIWYVDASAASGGTGSSWACAFQNLQDAIDAASSGHEIWVKAGVYKPTTFPTDCSNCTDRDKTFYLKNGVAVYGGFAGTETLRSQRNRTTNPTTLSGDIGTAGNNSDNCYHVVLSYSDANTTVLDGFTISGGNANGSGNMNNAANGVISRNCGGGIYNRSTSPVIENCIVSGNLASFLGAGIYNYTSPITLANSTVSGNTASNGGGGIYNDVSSGGTFTGCTISGNTANNNGGGMVNNYCSPTLTDCYFLNNTTPNAGGGMLNFFGSPIVTNCTFSNNVASSNSGGGVVDYNNGGTPTFDRCIFSGNSAAFSGGMKIAGGTVKNCVFSGNSATDAYGALSVHGNASITNCTFSGNSAANYTGGVMCVSSSPSLTNCLIWNNRLNGVTGSADANLTNYSSTPVITYSLIQNRDPSGTGNLNGIPNAANSNYPNFVTPLDPATAPSAAGDFHIQSFTPVANVGTGTGAPATDLFGNARPFSSAVDLGAHELQSANCPTTGTIWYVDAAAAGGGTGSSWECAFQNLQDAINSASSGHEIWVKTGTYLPTKDPFGSASPTDPRDKAFYLKDGVKIYGGFDGTETARSERDWVANPTILSGDIGTTGNNSDNCYHVVLSVSDAGTTELDGFTVSDGNANGSGFINVESNLITRSMGGGMHNNTTATAVKNITFSGNATNDLGGATYNSHTTSTFMDCIFSGNTASMGAGAFNTNSTLTYNECTFSGNTAGSGGGMRCQTATSVTLNECIFKGNAATSSDGGGFYIGTSSTNATLRNCLFFGNSSGGFGGGILNSATAMTLTNCTVSGNKATNGGGGILFSGTSGSQPIVKNCLVWNNRTGTTTGSATANLATSTSTPVISYSLIQNHNPGGTGNINGITNGANSNYPSFTTPLDPANAPSTSGDFQITNCSPVLNLGDNSDAPATDLFGNTRPYNSGVADMGAHELQSAAAAPPTINCPANQTATVPYSLADFTPLATTSGTCTPISVTQSPAIGTSLAVGTHTITMTATAGNGTTATCTFTVTVNSNCPDLNVAAPTGSATQTFCAGAQVSNLVATGTAIQWYDAATNGNLLATNTPLTNGTSYYASQTLNNCESANRLAVTVTANTVPTLVYGNISVNATASTTNSPTAATDNGSITGYIIQNPGTYTGTITVNASGVVSISSAAPVGSHTITIRATDNCSATTDASFTLTVSNNNPAISAGNTLTRQQGSAGTSATIATVNDTETPATSLTVTATTVPTGITITNITNLNGTVSATITANCNAVVGNNTIVLTVTDANGGTATANVTVNVTANILPTLTYGTVAVSAGGSTNTGPTAASDNGSIASYSVHSQGSYTGTVTVNSSGEVSFVNAGPVGMHTVLIRATDNCTVFTDGQITVNITCPPVTVSGVTLAQPTCATPTGTAVVNATGSGTLEYSKDGTNWVSSNTFSSLAPANYTFSVRLVSNPTCVATSTQQTINAVPGAPTLTGVTLTQPTCATPTGTAVVNATGSGTLEYSKDGTNWGSSNTFSSLAPANYTFSVRLVSNPTCVATSTQQTINTVPVAPTLSDVTLTQPTCAVPTGTAVVNATGSGTLEYSKDGTNWVSSNTFSSLAPANYTFSVRLVSNPTCVAIFTQQTINTVPGAPTLTGVTLTQPTCAVPTGTAVVNATGSGTLEYSKDGTNWGSSNTFSSLAPANYTFLVRLVSNPTCVATSTQQTINTVPGAPTLTGVTLTQPTCATPTGTAVVNATGSGTLEYSKDGSNWVSSNTFSGLAPANYTFSVRLQSNPTCVATSTQQTINTVPGAPTLSGVTLTQPTCAVSTGTAVVNATGSSTLEYSKDGTNWGSSNTFSSLAPANYTFSVRLVSNPTCVATSTQQTINSVPVAPTLTGVTLTQPTCATPTGTAVVNATGSGTLEYSKDGTNWGSSNTFSSLAPANYTFSVRLVANPTCAATSTQQTINTVPGAPTLTGVTLTQPTCATPTGTTVVNATGSGTLEYSKDGTNWQTNATFSSLAPANYTFSVRLQSNPTCVATSTQQTINAVPVAPTLSGVTLTQPTCATPTGTAVVNATGSGTLEYSKDGTNWGSSNTFSSLVPANYTFSVRLVANPTCVATSTQQTINTVPGAPTLTGVTLTQPTCATPTGTAVVNATGSGTLEYSKDGTNWGSSNTFSSLAPANYTFSVRLVSNPTCVATSTQQTINTVPGAPTLTGVTLTQPTCAATTGTAVVNATGSSTLEYSKDGSNWGSSNTFSGLAPANYTFSVRLVSNPTCVATSTQQTINAVPAAPTLTSVTLTQPTCATPTGTAVVNATGSGTLEYSKDGTNWTGSNTFSSLAPANYTFSVRLVSNPTCVATSTQQTINTVPVAPTLTGVTLTQPTCATPTGTAVVNATGSGTLEYSKDGTNWGSSNTFSSLAPANYTFSVRLVSNPTCVATSTPQTINAVPAAPTLTSVTLTQPTCATPTGTAVVNATGSGTLEYSKDGTNWVSSNTFSSLAPANYTFLVRLVSNPTCVATSTQQTINTVPGAPTLTGVTLTQPTCSFTTGTAVVNATGSGTLEYSKDGTNWSSSNTFSSLAPANYTFSVRLIANPTCVATSTQQTINAVTVAPTLTGVTLTQPTCATPTGTAVVNATGTLEYSKDGTNWGSSNTFSSLAPANYTFSVRLISNPTCVATSTQQTINTVPGAPTLTGITLTQPTCAVSTGTAVVNATGSGTLEYSKDGTNWVSSNTFSSLAPANYTFSVRLVANPTCVTTSTQQTINIVSAPSAAINYAGSPFVNAGTASATLTGNAGGSFSSTIGLSINAATGEINLALSTPGTYTVTYTIAANGSCPQFQTTTSVEIIASARIIYVNVSNTASDQDGSTWAKAFTSLQAGLQLAIISRGQTDGVQVWVAQGTYSPGVLRKDAFEIPSGVEVYGGFVGNETLLSERNWKTHTTTLSGEIGSSSLSDNVNHVVVLNATNAATRLDGFTIEKGFADFVNNVQNTELTEPAILSSGGGVLVINKSRGVITNCTITNNRAIAGGGILLQDSSGVSITKSIIWGNEATFGGGAYVLDGSTPRLENLLIVTNKALGGGLYINRSQPLVLHSTIAANQGTGGTAGGIFTVNAIVNIKNSILWGNTSPQSTAGIGITYSIVEGGYAGTGNSGQNPLFVNAGSSGLAPLGGLGDYRLQNCSPAINSGDNTDTSTEDLDGNVRPYAGVVDKGAYESQSIGSSSPAILTVTENISSGNVQKTAGKITATNQISGGVIEYRAGESVTLLPGFSAAGAIFQAVIGGCQTNGPTNIISDFQK